MTMVTQVVITGVLIIMALVASSNGDTHRSKKHGYAVLSSLVGVVVTHILFGVGCTKTRKGSDGRSALSMLAILSAVGAVGGFVAYAFIQSAAKAVTKKVQKPKPSPQGQQGPQQGQQAPQQAEQAPPPQQGTDQKCGEKFRKRNTASRQTKQVCLATNPEAQCEKEFSDRYDQSTRRLQECRNSNQASWWT